jgi:ribonuclease HI
VEGRVVRSGACPPYVKSSLEAEVAAIFAGIFLSRRTWGDAVRGVVVRTDCQAAIDHLSAESLRPRLQRRQPGLVRLREKIHALIEQHGIELELRWVKGHQVTNTAQAFLNRACDQLAGKARPATAPEPPRKKGGKRRRGRRSRRGRGAPAASAEGRSPVGYGNHSLRTQEGDP